MGKRTHTTRPATRKPTPAQLRRQLERADRQLIAALNERAKLVQDLAELAKDAPPDIDVAGDSETVDRAVEANKGPLADNCVRSILSELVSGARALVRPTRVAFLGPEYSYSHLAATRRFGESVEAAPVATIAAVFEEVRGGQSDFGLVPIENSTDGRIVDTLDRLARIPVQICGEVQLTIHHNLLGKGKRSTVRKVYSKPQALSQCRDWLATHLPQARTVDASSTTAAAATASEDPSVAAIASLQAGKHYGLKVIAANIEDNPNNVTRFAVIGDHEATATKDDKTSLMFQIPHQPGALADVMGIFKRNRLNLTWIESFPMPGIRSEYLFFVELEGHKRARIVQRALASLELKTVRLDVLGSYPKSPLFE